MDLKLQHDSVSCGTLTVWALQLASVWQQQGGVEPFSTYFTRQALRYYKDGVPDKSACRALEVRLRQEYCSAAGLMAARPNGPPFGVVWTVSHGHDVRTSSATSASSSVPPAMRHPPASTPTPSMPPPTCRTPAAVVTPTAGPPAYRPPRLATNNAASSPPRDPTTMTSVAPAPSRPPPSTAHTATSSPSCLEQCRATVRFGFRLVFNPKAPIIQTAAG
jgi:hypothetical protein